MRLLTLLLFLGAALSAQVFVPADGSYVGETLQAFDPPPNTPCLASAKLYNYRTGNTWRCKGAPGAMVYVSDGPLLNGSGLCALGDSLEGLSSSDILWGPTFFNSLHLLSGEQFKFVHNGGVPGNSTAQILARLQADALTQSCAKVLVLGGTNDVGVVPVQTTEANLLAIYTAIAANGQLPILATIPPSISSNYAFVSSLNAWIVKQSKMLKLPMVDLFAVLVDPATGNYKAGYSLDGVHPAGAAVRLAAQAALADLLPLFPPHHPLLPAYNSDPNNLVTNGLMLTSAGGIPSGWSANASSGHVVYTVAPDAHMAGNAFIATKTTGAAGDADNASYNIFGWSPGDKIAFTGRIVTTGLEAGAQQLSIYLYGYSAGFASLVLQASPVFLYASEDVPFGQWYLETTIPANVAFLGFQINYGTGTGVVKLGQIGIYDLTKMGL